MHIQEVKVINDESGKAKNVIGKGINTTARIEPIVKENEVYCSERFYDHLNDEENINIKGFSLGTKSLAKDFGKMKIYKLAWDYEKPESSIELSIPKVKRIFSENEKNDFVINAFSKFKKGFVAGLKNLEEEYEFINTEYIKYKNDCFVCKIHRQDKLVAKCKIWLDKNFSSLSQIYYSESFMDINDNSHNECLYVEDDGFQIGFKATMFSLSNVDMENVHYLTEDMAIVYLWKRLTNRLKDL